MSSRISRTAAPPIKEPERIAAEKPEAPAPGAGVRRPEPDAAAAGDGSSPLPGPNRTAFHAKFGIDDQRAVSHRRQTPSQEAASQDENPPSTGRPRGSENQRWKAVGRASGALSSARLRNGIVAWGTGVTLACRAVQALMQRQPAREPGEVMGRFAELLRPLASFIDSHSQHPAPIVGPGSETAAAAEHLPTPGELAAGVRELIGADGPAGPQDELSTMLAGMRDGPRAPDAAGFYAVMALLAEGVRISEMMRSGNEPGWLNSRVLNFEKALRSLLKEAPVGVHDRDHAEQLTSAAVAALKVPFEFPGLSAPLSIPVASLLYRNAQSWTNRRARGASIADDMPQKSMTTVLGQFLELLGRPAEAGDTGQPTPSA